MSNYAESLCYPEQLPPVIIHQIRLEDMSMSGQASNMPFSDSAIQRAVIERVFDERKKYLIIALTGKIGAGSSYVSSFIQNASNGKEIPCSSSECNNYSSDEERADNILLRYFECNRIPFHVIIGHRAIWNAARLRRRKPSLMSGCA